MKIIKPVIYLFLLSCMSMLSACVSKSIDAPNSREDYDLDNDGLIEINSLEDLNEIRNNLDGATLYGKNNGCPSNSCNGFELTTDLDFDTNKDGKMDANDAYWNKGEGWAGIGFSDDNDGFNGIFDGNGYAIYNLYINRPFEFEQGLFGYAEGATFRRINILGPLTSITGAYYVGPLLGYAENLTYIEGCFVEARTNAADEYGGGLVGRLANSQLHASYSTGEVRAPNYAGALVGRMAFNSTVEATYSTATAIITDIGTPGYIGLELGGQGKGNYWAAEVADNDRQETASPLSIAALRCDNGMQDSLCDSDEFTLWKAKLDPEGKPYWQIDKNGKLPYLNSQKESLRDDDGDMVVNSKDAWPMEYAASIDSDNDGATDYYTLNCDSRCQQASGILLDQYPQSPQVSLDTDLDNMPDSWNQSCDAACQNESSFNIDPFPNDVDNDGISDAEDTDDNNDDKADIDLDSDGYIDIDSLEKLDAIRYQLDGLAFRATNDGETDISGCPPRVVDGTLQRSCAGYELTKDLNFDLNDNLQFDQQDPFWNDGKGWLPIGISNETPFTGVFVGNGFTIFNLSINRIDQGDLGLFSQIRNATIKNLKIDNKINTLVGQYNIGALTGRSLKSNIEAVSVNARVNATLYKAGGLIGDAQDTEILAVYIDGGISAQDRAAGGIVGTSSDYTQIVGSYFSGTVNSPLLVGAIFGETSANDILLEASYATLSTNDIIDSKNAESLSGSKNIINRTSYWTNLNSNSNTGNDEAWRSAAELQCASPTNPDTCDPSSDIFNGWDTYKYSNGESIWDFSDTTDFPSH